MRTAFDDVQKTQPRTATLDAGCIASMQLGAVENKVVRIDARSSPCLHHTIDRPCIPLLVLSLRDCYLKRNLLSSG